MAAPFTIWTEYDEDDAEMGMDIIIWD